MNISEPFIRRPVMTTLVMIAILVFGIFSYKSLPVSDLPNIEYPTITVTAQQPGGSPDYMANLVATPMERNFTTISGLNTMTSSSTLGQSQIVLNFDLDVNIDTKEVEVQAAITETQPDLPPMPYNPTYQITNPSETPILFLCLTSATQPLAKLYELGYNVIAQPISMISGISQVQVYGYPFAVRVQADPLKLTSYNIDLNYLFNTLTQANPNLPSGTLQGDYRNVTLDTYGQLSDGAYYDQVIIKQDNGFPLRVENIGKSINALEDRYPYFRYVSKDKNENVVVLAVTRLPGSNTIDISNAILDKLPTLQKSIPDSVDLFIFYDKAQTIIASVKDVQVTLIIALCLAVSVIFLYLGKIFDTFVPSLVLPLAMIATFIVMYLVGFNLDNLSLLALTLAIGFIVDDAIVVQENIVRHVEMGKKPFDASLDGSKQISVTVFTMTIALSAVFIPMIWMPGILGRIFHEFAVTIVVAILCSGFLSLSLNPMLCSRFLPARKPLKEGEKKNFSQRFNESFERVYERTLLRTMRFPLLTVAVAIVCIILSLFFAYILPGDFLPPGNVSIIEGQTRTYDGNSAVDTIRHQEKVDEIIRNNSHISSFFSIAGYPTTDTGILYLHLVDANKRPKTQIVNLELLTQLAHVPGMNTFAKPIPTIDLQVGNTSSLGEYQYTMISTDVDLLYHYAEIMTQKMKQMPDLLGVNNDMKRNSPQLNITIDRDRAGIYGITAEQIESTLQYAYSGGRISTFNLDTNLYDLIVEVDPAFDLTERDLDLLYIQSSTTQSLVPLTEVATWKLVASPAEINHINIFPSVTISFGVMKGVALGTVLDEINAMAKEILPDTIDGSVQGSAEVFVETFKSMGYLFVIAIFVIYVLLGILYESFIHPITILSALPVATTGGLLTLILFHQPLSLYSVVGLIVLVGLVQKNGIMMVDFALEYLERPGEPPRQAIIEACKARFRPIMMTSFAAIMGALPVAIGFGENGDTNRPLGLVVVGGLLFSQLITLFVTPVVFLYMHRLEAYVTRSKSKKTPPSPPSHAI